MAACRPWLKWLGSESKCTLCGEAISCDPGSLCFQCRQIYAGLRWSGCTRCGSHACSGACNELPYFQSITSLYTYASFHRQLLIMAKEKQSGEAIFVLFEVYGHQVTEKIKELIITHSVTDILIARVRLKRLVELNWHPFEFWHCCACRAVYELHAQKHLQYKIPVQTFLPEGLKKRSFLNSEKRRAQVAIRSKKTRCRAESLTQSATESVLILDDVLTSGGTILDELAAVGALRQQSPHVAFHAMTLFRTPRSQRAVEERESDGLVQTFL